MKPFTVQNNDMKVFLTQLSHFADKKQEPTIVDACQSLLDFLYPSESDDIKGEFTGFTENNIKFHDNE